MIEKVTAAAVLLSALLAWAYAMRLMLVRWWRSAIGWERAFTAGVYVTLFTLAALNAVGVHDYPGRAVVRMCCWLVIVVMLGAKLALLLAGQRAGRRRSEGT